MLGSTAIEAATPTIPYERPSERELEAPALQPEQLSPPEFTLPPIPSTEYEPGVETGVLVKNIVLEGNSVFSDEELLRVVDSYINKTVSSGDLQHIRIELTKYYVDRGYINSGVIIPDQKIEHGVIRFKIIEGQLSVVQLSGQKRLHHDYIYERILLGVDKPLNITNLQSQLFLLQQDPRITRVNAQLQPGARRGESILYVDVQEADVFSAHFTANNYRPPSVGAERGILELAHLNLTGMGDTVQFRYGITEGLDDVYVYYDYPLTPSGTKLSVYYEDSDSEVIEEPFSSLDVSSQSNTVGMGIDVPMYRSPNEQLDMGLKLEKRKSQTFLFDMPFSFEAGPQEGLSRVSVARYYLSWFKRGGTSIGALRSTLSFGVDAMDATVNDGNTPDSKFLSWLGQFQWLKRFSGNDSHLLARASIQLTDDPLLPMEQFSVGGANSVRGYRENQLVGDYGFFASLEYRYPLLKQTQGGHFQILTFAEYGQIRNKDRVTPDLNDIYSIGTGLRWANKAGMEFDIYWGVPLRDVKNPDDDLQDDGIHLQFRMKLL